MRDPSPDPAELVDSAADVWLTAARLAGRTTFDSGLMRALLNPFPALEFCSFDCRCAEIASAEYLGLRNLPLLGFEVSPADTQKPGRTPVVWFTDDCVCCEWRDGSMERSAIFRAQPRRRSVTPCRRDEIERAYSLKRLRGHSRSRHARLAEAVLNAAAAGMRPKGLVVCPSRLSPSENGCGTSAVRSLLHSWDEKTPFAVLTRSIERWSRQIAASMPVFGLFGKLANDRETRDFADSIVEFGDIILQSVIDSVSRVKSRSLRSEGYWGLRNVLLNRLNPVPMGFDAVAPASLTVALRACGVDSGVSALLSDSGLALNESDLHELVYLARTGSSVYRQLAARALRGSDSEAVISTLRQLLYDVDSYVSDAAWDAVGARAIAGGWWRRVYESVPETRVGSRSSLRPQILHQLSEEPTEEARAFLILAMSEVERPDSAEIRAVAADGLYNRFEDHSVDSFIRAAESGGKDTRKLARHYLNRIQGMASEAVESNLREPQ